MSPRSFLGIARLPLFPSSRVPPVVHVRGVKHHAYDASLDPDDLEEARKWHVSFNKDSLPKAHTTYSRSSGPGGQHVNKTETKATSVWPIGELSKILPKLMRPLMSLSRYYVKGSDSIMIQAQTERSKTANRDANDEKLVNEIHRIYRENIPGVPSEKKMKKHEAAEKAANQHRLKAKKHNSSKKAFRKGGE
ncbi:hypothetical protein F5Y08DRAFT_315579 [Xylaria arbuscula]|nr:hypothetical protein F5Y08DRAFT_315579 [Xylaria arbuscula]